MSWKTAGSCGDPVRQRTCWRCSPTTSPRVSGSTWRRTHPSRAWTWRAHCTTMGSTSWAATSACPPAWSTGSFSSTTSSQMPGRPSDASQLWDRTCCCVRFTSLMCCELHCHRWSPWSAPVFAQIGSKWPVSGCCVENDFRVRERNTLRCTCCGGCKQPFGIRRKAREPNVQHTVFVWGEKTVYKLLFVRDPQHLFKQILHVLALCTLMTDHFRCKCSNADLFNKSNVKH